MDLPDSVSILAAIVVIAATGYFWARCYGLFEPDETSLADDMSFRNITYVCFAYSWFASAGPIIFLGYIFLSCFGCEPDWSEYR
jgi:hypothetical protein